MEKNFTTDSTDKKAVEATFPVEERLVDALIKHDENGVVPFHMPGHKRKNFDYLCGTSKIDITEIDGFDNLHDASGVIARAEERAARLFGTISTRFLVGGSTAGILSAIRAMTRRNDAILVARNCHKSVFNAIEICGLRPFYVEPSCFDEYGFYGSVSPQKVKDALEKNNDIKLAVITSPTYEGVISDIKSIADICHERGVLLFVDEAHGAHLGLSDCFEQSARNLDADAVVNSLHKTLPSLTQTALLHVCSQRVDAKRVDVNLAMFQSSSPSYVLMSSIDGCVDYLCRNKDVVLSKWRDDLNVAREKLSHLKNVRLFDGREEKAFAYDESKLVFCLDKCGETGVEFKKELREKHGIELEMASTDYAIAMSGLGDDESSFAKLVNAVSAVDAALERNDERQTVKLPELPQKAFEPYQIDALSCDYVDFDDCVGMVAAENVWAYPPGCPVLVKGEVVQKDLAEYVEFAVKSGVNVTSETRQFPSKLLTVQNKVDLP